MRGAWASKCGRRAAGARGGELLPLLLKPGSLTKMPKAERAALRRRVGIDSFADMARPAVRRGVPVQADHRPCNIVVSAGREWAPRKARMLPS